MDHLNPLATQRDYPANVSGSKDRADASAEFFAKFAGIVKGYPKSRLDTKCLMPFKETAR